MRALGVADLLLVDRVDVARLPVPTVKPVDPVAAVREASGRGGTIAVAENHSNMGGLREAVASSLLHSGVAPNFRHIAFPNEVLDAGALPTLHDRYGIPGEAGRRPDQAVALNAMAAVATIGVVGLGAMGAPMVANLLKAGFTVRGFDVNPAALQRLSGLGGASTRSAAEAATGADVLLLMVVDAAQARDLLMRRGALAAMRPDALVLLMATCPPGEVETSAAEVTGQGSSSPTLRSRAGLSELKAARSPSWRQRRLALSRRSARSSTRSVTRCFTSASVPARARWSRP